ncbi:MAG TPA: glycoside hydrolase family 13 protein [Bacilli bacterium]
MITNYYHEPATDITLTSLKELDIRLKLPRVAHEVKLIAWNKARRQTAGIEQIEMFCWAESDEYAYYRIVWMSMEPRVRYLQYTFKFTMGGRVLWLNADGLHEIEENPVKGAFEFPYGGDRDTVHIPEWIRDRVWYQIFPERFYNGDAMNDPSDTMPWGTPPTRDNTMGGDLQGILQKVDYLKELGINALYLNPIFKAKSNHKYDTLDYFAIDPQFGTLQDLKLLTERCHQLGMKVVLDLVINHCGYDHPCFQDVVRHGEESPYRDWFYVHEFPVSLSDSKYDSVWYYQWMPKLKTSNPQVKQFVFDIVSFWQKEADIDGWRIDVADEVEVSFLRELNSHVKKMNKDIFIISEIWHDAKRLMMSGGTDSVMNYDLRSILIDYVLNKSITIDQFHALLVRYANRYSAAELNQMFNLLGSHDTERILSLCGNRIDRLILLMALQYMIPGNPVVYYGDELGFLGENDPGCRACMRWDTDYTQQPLWNFVRQWNQLKATEEVLQHGYLELQYAAVEELYVVKRKYGSKEAFILLNFSNEDQELTQALSHFGLDSANLHEVKFPMDKGLERLLSTKQFKLFLNYTF